MAKAIVEWGAYYNGLAAALRIGDERSCKLDGEWLALSASEQVTIYIFVYLNVSALRANAH